MKNTRHVRKSTKRRTSASRRTSGNPARPRIREPRPPFADGDWETVEGAARYLKLSPERLRFFARKGIVPAFRLAGEDRRADKENTRRRSNYRFLKQDIDAWLASQRVQVKLADVHPPTTRATEATV
jgi:hypothetical protein